MDHFEPNQICGAATTVWQSVWVGLEELVRDTRDMLGNHLRDAILETSHLSDDGGRQAGELRIGRTRLRLECSPRCVPASREERLLLETFGPEAALVRIFVYRELDGGGRRLESMLVASLAAGMWISTEPELGPAPITDRESLERFFWSLLVDRT
jgi:hypothetical protein